MAGLEVFSLAAQLGEQVLGGLVRCPHPDQLGGAGLGLLPGGLQLGEIADDTGADQLAFELIAFLEAANVTSLPQVHHDVDARLSSLGYDAGHRVIELPAKGPQGTTPRAAIPPYASAALDRCLELRGPEQGPLFRTDTGRPLDQPAIFRKLREIAREAQAATRGQLSPHSPRHSVATYLLGQGEPPHYVQELLGHADPHHPPLRPGPRHPGAPAPPIPGAGRSTLYRPPTRAITAERRIHRQWFPRAVASPEHPRKKHARPPRGRRVTILADIGIAATGVCGSRARRWERTARPGASRIQNHDEEHRYD
ncbi:tyrosine-type recombinase/integrase [Streptosporangium sp. V21-05]|uniref:tyrosine-type recombinase/integrase n=1 Tax=Streptosporangium sp. V21-05 TaxID=3446115 RepID=UPI003F52F732